MRAVAVVLTVMFVLGLAGPVKAQSVRNLAVNYSFEQGFDSIGDDGEVGKGWAAFKTSGSLSFRNTEGLSPGFVEKIEGSTSQTLWSDGSSFVAGLWQKRSVIPGKMYKAWYATAAKVKGGGPMARTIGLDPTGGENPNAGTVTWGSRYDGEKWATIEQGNAPVARVAATGSQITVFLKVENGGGGQNQAYLDSIFLVEDGDAPGGAQPAAVPPPTGGGSQPPAEQASPTPIPGVRPPGTDGRNDYTVENGWFYSQANGQDAGGNVGYVVSNNDGVPFWTWFQRYGGVNAVGYPVSHRFQWEGFTSQAFQKAVFQYRPDQGGAVVFVNVFDALSKAGKDDWLLTVRDVPKSNDWAVDNGKDWPTVVQNHQKLLDQYPSIRTAYFGASDPINQFGLPMGSQEFTNVIVVRAQRSVFQQWKIDVPWARAGQVVIANGGDIAKESGVLPAESVAPQYANYRPTTLPSVNLNPPAAPPAAPANTPGPAAPPPANTPAPQPQATGPYSVESVNYLPNCGLTQLKVYVKNAQGQAVNGLIARIEWSDQKLESNPTGKPGSYDPGWTDIILRNGTIQNGWRVSIYENGQLVGGPVDVQTTDDCRSPDAKQIINVTFKKNS